MPAITLVRPIDHQAAAKSHPIARDMGRRPQQPEPSPAPALAEGHSPSPSPSPADSLRPQESPPRRTAGPLEASASPVPVPLEDTVGWKSLDPQSLLSRALGTLLWRPKAAEHKPLDPTTPTQANPIPLDMATPIHAKSIPLDMAECVVHTPCNNTGATHYTRCRTPDSQSPHFLTIPCIKSEDEYTEFAIRRFCNRTWDHPPRVHKIDKASKATCPTLTVNPEAGFGHGMVLPHRRACVSGFAIPGQTIKIKAHHKQLNPSALPPLLPKPGVYVVPPGECNFTVCLGALDRPSGMSYTLELTAESRNTTEPTQRLFFQRVWFGDVYFCVGQSNMETHVDESIGAPEEYPYAEHLRLFKYRPHRRWTDSGEAFRAAFSAVCYSMGLVLYRQLTARGRVHPIGLVQYAYAGLPLSSFLPLQTLQQINDDVRNISLAWGGSSVVGCRSSTFRGCEKLFQTRMYEKTVADEVRQAHYARAYHKSGALGGLMPLLTYPRSAVAFYQGEADVPLLHFYQLRLHAIFRMLKNSPGGETVPLVQV